MAATDRSSRKKELMKAAVDEVQDREIRPVFLPVRVRGGIEHYYRRVSAGAVDVESYAPTPEVEDWTRAYLVEAHRIVDDGNEQWWLVYAAPDGSAVAVPPSEVVGHVGLRHALLVPDDDLSNSHADVDRLRNLVEECHEVGHA